MRRSKKSAVSIPNSNSLTEQVCRVMRRPINRGMTVIVGVSGGPDSVALLHLLWRLRYELGIKIIAAHFNHGLRRSADADQKFVESLSEKLSIPFVYGRPKTKKSGSLEDWARQERFRFFNHALKKYRAQILVLAHTQDDLAETVLMRILRGTGLLGLRGILDERAVEGMSVVRPMLGVEKKDILRYLRDEKLSFRLDGTNLKPDFYRNKIRLKLLPLLRRNYNPNIQQVLTNLSDNARVDYEFLSAQAVALLRAIGRRGPTRVALNYRRYRSAHRSMRRMLLRLAYEQLKGDLKTLTFNHIHEAEAAVLSGATGRLYDLPGGISIRKTRETLLVELLHE